MNIHSVMQNMASLLIFRIPIDTVGDLCYNIADSNGR